MHKRNDAKRGRELWRTAVDALGIVSTAVLIVLTWLMWLVAAGGGY